MPGLPTPAPPPQESHEQQHTLEGNMTAKHSTDPLARLRRQATVKMIHVSTAQTGQHTPPWEWRTIRQQLQDMGFRRIDSSEQTQHELAALDWFLTTWLDLLPVNADIYWPDPHHDDGSDDE
jgi:hypothetical protein